MSQEEKSKKVIEGCTDVYFLKGYIIGLSMLIDQNEKREKRMIEERSWENEE